MWYLGLPTKLGGGGDEIIYLQGLESVPEMQAPSSLPPAELLRLPD